MPKAAMDENYLPHADEHDIWYPWKVSTVQPVAITQRVDKPSHHEFRLRVLATDTAHTPAAFHYGQCVRHGSWSLLFDKKSKEYAFALL